MEAWQIAHLEQLRRERELEQDAQRPQPRVWTPQPTPMYQPPEQDSTPSNRGVTIISMFDYEVEEDGD